MRRYKLIEYLIEDHSELYDLENDIGEMHNLAEKRPSMHNSSFDASFFCG